jgi:hypothetical protein
MAKDKPKGNMKDLSGPHKLGPAWQVPGYATAVFVHEAASGEVARAVVHSVRNAGVKAKAAPHLHR